MQQLLEHRTYNRSESIIFHKTKEAFGGLSNMAAGYPLIINETRILTSEALYQACRFPHLPNIQRLIIDQRSPMTAKMKSKPYRIQSRPDWDVVRIKIMRWCLQVKLVQNWESFGNLLLSTEQKPIVEQSSRDPFWGAIPQNANDLCGTNILGRLLVELRELLRSNSTTLQAVKPPLTNDFLFYGKPIQIIVNSSLCKSSSTTHPNHIDNIELIKKVPDAPPKVVTFQEESLSILSKPANSFVQLNIQEL